MSENKKEIKEPITNKKKIIIIVSLILAAIALCAIIIVIAVNAVEDRTPLNGEFSMSVMADRELSSVYKFEDDRATLTYTEGQETVTVEYTYRVTKAGEGREITFTDIKTDEEKTYSYSEMTKDGELIAIIINTVVYYKV